MYSSRPKARTAHINSARFAPENLLLRGRNLTCGVAQGLTYVQYASTLRALRIRTRFLELQNLRRCVLQRLMYSSRPRARISHIDSVSLVDENPPLEGRNLTRGVAQGLTYVQYASTLRALRIRTRS